MVAPSSHPAFAWSMVGWLDFLDFIQQSKNEKFYHEQWIRLE
jgi:hypothetical protein